jgi:hypothetical protein
MRSANRVLLGALLALCCSGTATANSPEADPTVNTADLRAVTHMQLDGALEEFAFVESGPPIQELSGPSSMDCEDARLKDEVETCVVTTSAPVTPMPAAMAQN